MPRKLGTTALKFPKLSPQLLTVNVSGGAQSHHDDSGPPQWGDGRANGDSTSSTVLLFSDSLGKDSCSQYIDEEKKAQNCQ